MDYTALRDTVLKLKERIIKTEAGDTQLSETDTRQGLINPLFRALQWDFSDFDSMEPGRSRGRAGSASPWSERSRGRGSRAPRGSVCTPTGDSGAVRHGGA